MQLNKININQFSTLVIVLLTGINMYFMYVSSVEHQYQKRHLIESLQQDALSQFRLMESLIYWSVKIDNKIVQDFTMHKESNETGMQFMFPYLAEKNKKDIYNFRLTSPYPLNPNNTPNPFESRGFRALLMEDKTPYYQEFSPTTYDFIGRLDTQKSCTACHNNRIGQLRGGIHISIPLTKYNEQIASLDKESVHEKILLLTLFFISIGTFILFTYIVKSKNEEITETNEHLEQEISARTLQLNRTFDQTIHSFIKMVEARDSYTAGHSSRVQKYSNLIANYLQYDDDFIDRLDKAAYLHDIGKLYTPDSILLKPGKLNGEEYELIRQHAIKGYETLNQIDVYKDIALIVGAHHERYDGSGYPHGLKGDEIPIESRIMAIADTFDAMTTNRIYKSRMDVKAALEEISSLKGKDFDPEITDLAVKALSTVEIEYTTQLPDSGPEHQRLSYHFKDALTGLYNMPYLNILISLGLNAKTFECLNIITLKNFHQYNQKHGWHKGNELLINFAKKLQKLYPDSYLFRVFGDDFIILNEKHLELSSKDFEDCDLLNINYIGLEVNHYDLRHQHEKEAILELLLLHS
jgi:putative nucleotidyltransferase with HDIG domain